ncbi:response regulator transcription factor [Aequorivita sp. Q41]|uniref:response regulator transcription factor n=1 Tax=Aequorivita sp. Q41 TaxID=3153300 RepID=UPI00324264E8
MFNKKDISIVIADDHPMLLRGLLDEFEANGYNVIGNSANGTQALEQILNLQPTIAILDIDMPLLSGFEIVKMAKEKYVKTKFIIFSYHREAEFVIQAKSLQIDGYLLKEDPFIEIEKCMDAVLNDKVYFSSSFNSQNLNDVSNEIKKLNWLTPSEITILKLIAQEKTNTEIADILSISVRTVEKHRSNIISKIWNNKTSKTLSAWAITHKNLIINY